MKKSRLKKYTLDYQLRKEMLKQYIASMGNEKTEKLSKKEIEKYKEEFHKWYDKKDKKEQRILKKNFLRRNPEVNKAYKEAIRRKIAVCAGGILTIGSLTAFTWKLTKQPPTLETSKQVESDFDLVENRKTQEDLLVESQERQAYVESLPDFFEQVGNMSDDIERNNEIRDKTEEALSLAYNQKCMEDEEKGEVRYIEVTGTVIENLDAMQEVMGYQLETEQTQIDNLKQREREMKYYVFTLNGKRIAACTCQGEKIYGDINISFEDAAELIGKTKALQNGYTSKNRGAGESEDFIKDKENAYTTATRKIVEGQKDKNMQEELAKGRE